MCVEKTGVDMVQEITVDSTEKLLHWSLNCPFVSQCGTLYMVPNEVGAIPFRRMAGKEKALEKLEKQKRSLECKNLHDYLKTLPNEVLDQLYNTPATCLAVFRELPALAKQFVMRLLHVHQAVPKTVVSSWVVHAFAKESARSQEVLTSLRLWYGATLPGGLEAWLLNGTFR